MTTHPDIPTDELERLAEQITEGPWAAFSEHPLNACAEVRKGHTNIATCYGGDDPCDSPAKGEPWPNQPRRDANARAIALVPALIRKSIEDDATIKAMRALLRAGCDLLAIESEALREGISIGGVMSPGPEDAHIVEAIREIEDWIASVKATLYPTTAGDSHENDR